MAQADQTTAADEQQSLVEDGAYPGAEKILADDNVRLISGDGHILYANCAAPPSGPVKFIEVRTSESAGAGGEGTICFKVTGTRGYLTLNVPSVFEIRGDGHEAGAGHKTKAELSTPSGQHKTVEVDPNGSTQVGISLPNGQPEALLRLEVRP